MLYEKLGHLDPAKLSTHSIDQVEELLRSFPRKPHYPRKAAKTIVDLSSLVATQFGGNAAYIWQDKAPKHVLGTLTGIWGVGRGISHIIVRILIDGFGYNPGPEGFRQIDVKADAHVRKVFYRAGLAPDKNESASIEAARRLHPQFPGLLDWPAWEIGRTYCRRYNPKCMICPLYRVCPRIGTER